VERLPSESSTASCSKEEYRVLSTVLILKFGSLEGPSFISDNQTPFYRELDDLT
jgi:hypothetical protein